MLNSGIKLDKKLLSEIRGRLKIEIKEAKLGGQIIAKNLIEY